MMTLATYVLSPVRTVDGGLVPDPLAAEQQFLWLAVTVVLLCVLAVKLKARLARG